MSEKGSVSDCEQMSHLLSGANVDADLLRQMRDILLDYCQDCKQHYAKNSAHHCPRDYVDCSARDVGCDERPERRNLEAHQSRCPLLRDRRAILVERQLGDFATRLENCINTVEQRLQGAEQRMAEAVQRIQGVEQRVGEAVQRIEGLRPTVSYHALRPAVRFLQKIQLEFCDRLIDLSAHLPTGARPYALDIRVLQNNGNHPLGHNYATFHFRQNTAGAETAQIAVQNYQYFSIIPFSVVVPWRCDAPPSLLVTCSDVLIDGSYHTQGNCNYFDLELVGFHAH